MPAVPAIHFNGIFAVGCVCAPWITRISMHEADVVPLFGLLQRAQLLWTLLLVLSRLATDTLIIDCWRDGFVGLVRTSSIHNVRLHNFFPHVFGCPLHFSSLFHFLGSILWFSPSLPFLWHTQQISTQRAARFYSISLALSRLHFFAFLCWELFVFFSSRFHFSRSTVQSTHMSFVFCCKFKSNEHTKSTSIEQLMKLFFLLATSPQVESNFVCSDVWLLSLSIEFNAPRNLIVFVRSHADHRYLYQPETVRVRMINTEKLFENEKYSTRNSDRLAYASTAQLKLNSRLLLRSLSAFSLFSLNF